MLDWIIHALGGFTKEEYRVLEATDEGWRMRALAAETSLALFKEIMTREEERSKRLEERLFPNNAPQMQRPPEMNPVGQNKVSSWPRIKRELERLERVPNARVSREEIEKTIREKEQDAV